MSTVDTLFLVFIVFVMFNGGDLFFWVAISSLAGYGYGTWWPTVITASAAIVILLVRIVIEMHERRAKELDRMQAEIERARDELLARSWRAAHEDLRARAEAFNRAYEQQRRQQQPRKKSWREVLGVGADATRAQVRAAYAALTKRYHPDHNPSADPKKLEQVIDAWRQAQTELQ